MPTWFISWSIATLAVAINAMLTVYQCQEDLNVFTAYCQVVVAINICNVRAAMGIKLYVMRTHHTLRHATCDMWVRDLHLNNGYISEIGRFSSVFHYGQKEHYKFFSAVMILIAKSVCNSCSIRFHHWNFMLMLCSLCCRFSDDRRFTWVEKWCFGQQNANFN